VVRIISHAIRACANRFVAASKDTPLSLAGGRSLPLLGRKTRVSVAKSTIAGKHVRATFCDGSVSAIPVHITPPGVRYRAPGTWTVELGMRRFEGEAEHSKYNNDCGKVTRHV
jgi:hypothetical protein